ncbi:MAG: nuclear transport factor 2 family protein [Microlunatus sp.]
MNQPVEEAVAGSATDPGIEALVQQVAQAADSWVRGDVARYLELTVHVPGFTFMAPYGGVPSQHDDRASEFDGWESPFADGEATPEITAVHAWGDTAVVVMVERQHGRVADLPDQDLSLRVTEVYRRGGDGWELVHRHADPLVRALPTDQFMALLAG